MKNLLLCIVLAMANFTSAQISRVVQSKILPDAFGSNGIYDNLNLHQYSIKTSSIQTDTTVLENIVYDKLGNVLEVNYSFIPQNFLNFTKIIGVFKKADNNHLIHVVRLSSSSPILLEHVILEYNPLTNTLVQNTPLSFGNLLRHTGPSISVGDAIVTYVVRENSGLWRIAISKQTLAILSEEQVVAQSITNGGNFVTTIGVTLSGSTEYISCSPLKKIFKRNGANNYSTSQTILPLWTTTANSSLAVSGAKVGLVYFNRFCLFSTNLDSLESGVITTTVGSLSNSKVVALNNHFYVLEQTNETRIHKYDLNFQLLDVIGLRAKFENAFFDVRDGKLSFLSNLTFGALSLLSENGSELPPSAPINNTVAFMANYNDPKSSFQDLGIVLKAENVEMNTSNAFLVTNLSFFGQQTNNVGGTSYVSNNLKTTLLFSAANNVVAKNDSNILGTYGTFTNRFYQYGPMTNVSDYNWELQAKYSRGFYVTKKMIQNHIDSLTFGSIYYVPDHGVREWPAHGNTAIGQPANIAPFVDLNSNGIYEPLFGEYPAIFGDECYLAVGHMSPGTPGSTEMELHSYRYTFSCDTSSIFRKTIFQRNHFIPRGFALDSVYVGLNADFDVGNLDDDYVGTNVELGLIYAYNADFFDESVSGNQGFGDTIPAYGILTLEGIKQKSDGLDNAVGAGLYQSINGVGFGDGIVDNEYLGLTASVAYTNSAIFPFSDPYSVPHEFFHSQGKYSDGSSQTINSGGIPYNHAFFGNSDSLFYSSQGLNHGNNNFEGTSMNTPGDRRLTAFSGPGMASVDDTISTLTAFLYTTDSVNVSPLNSVQKLFVEAALLKSFFVNNDAGCGNTFGTIQPDLTLVENSLDNIKIYPNPTKEKFAITGMEGKTEILLLDMNGRVLFSTSSEKPTVEIDLSNFSEGMYFVQLTSERGSALKKVIRK